MQFQLPFKIGASAIKLQHNDAVMLCGSCFTENIGNQLSEVKMNTCINPQGIIFNPMSMAKCLQSCIDATVYNIGDLFQLNDVWNHWDFHSRFSNINKDDALTEMNTSIEAAHQFLKTADWLILTFGSSFQYFLNHSNDGFKERDSGVANCHKAPGAWFEKRMLGIAEMEAEWNATLQKLYAFNPRLKIIFTISPVRHYRDGLVENNLSKARLFELVHALSKKNEGGQYFPAFEIVNDVLRDYRFFEQDMVHPNIQAIQFVWEQFQQVYFDAEGRDLVKLIQEIKTALNHKPRFATTDSHQKFREQLKGRIEALKERCQYLDYEKEMANLA
jgi:hypothetical protein